MSGHFHGLFYIAEVAEGCHRLVGILAQDVQRLEERHEVFVECPDRAVVFVSNTRIPAAAANGVDEAPIHHVV